MWCDAPKSASSAIDMILRDYVPWQRDPQLLRFIAQLVVKKYCRYLIFTGILHVPQECAQDVPDAVIFHSCRWRFDRAH